MTTFSGGAALEAKLAELAEKLGEPMTLRMGFLENATYPDGTKVALAAAAAEWGNPANGQPPRPYFRNMISANSPQWGDDFAKIAIASNYDARKSLSLMGEHMKSQLQDSIRELTEPQISPVTVLLRERFGNNHHEIKFSDVQAARADVANGVRGSASGKPLIWSGHMLNSVDYDIKDGV
ncbi:hypothetical protein [Citrobacter koseri]|uniref:hypothetical protein n=1 Tax=Citrobacter koseri TaxID=545 RepID=UPI001F1C65CC|nr:hypothetical protein [Citrobacter koseri]